MTDKGWRGLPNWVWAALAAGLTLLITAIAAVVVLYNGPSYPDVSSTSTSTPSASPPGSGLIAEVQLPPGRGLDRARAASRWV